MSERNLSGIVLNVDHNQLILKLDNKSLNILENVIKKPKRYFNTSFTHTATIELKNYTKLTCGDKMILDFTNLQYLIGKKFESANLDIRTWYPNNSNIGNLIFYLVSGVVF
jgi:hypothetical protein